MLYEHELQLLAISEGNQAMQEAGNLPTKLHFSIGGFMGECHEVEWKKWVLWYRRAEAASMGQPAIELSPSSEAWARFWVAIETAGVWRWKNRYEDNDILDGTQWSLKLKYQGRSVSCRGSNAYPGSDRPDYAKSSEFGQFVKALQQLTGRKDIQ